MTPWRPTERFPTRKSRNDELTRLWHTGLPAENIAKRVGLETRASVYDIARVLGLPKRRGGENRQCSTPGCGQPAYAGGLCRREYQRHRRLEKAREKAPHAAYERDPLADVRHLAEPLPPRAKTPYEIAHGYPPGKAPE